MPDLYGHLTPQGVLNGSLQTIVFANNYNDLINKPSINFVELQGNKTAADLGLLTAGDIPVDSVNGKQGVVILDGDDIEYSAGVSLSDQIDNVAAAIPSVPVLSVNSKTGAVMLDGDDIEYEAGTSVNSKITDLEAEIGSGPVISVNGQQGVVELDGTDINYSLTKTLNQKIDEVAASIPVVSYPVTSVNTKTGDVVLDGDDIDYAEGVTVNDQIGTNTTDIGDLSQLTTSDKSSLVGAVNEVVSTKATTGSAITFAPETGITVNAVSAVINKTVLLNLTFSGSFTLNTWKKIGAMNVTPSISTIYVAGIHSSDGLYAGMIQIRSDKGIYFYPKTAISGTVGCTANFNIT